MHSCSAMKRLLLLSLLLAGCSAALPKVAVEARQPAVEHETSYLVWSRSDQGDGTRTYETSLVAEDGTVLAHRPGVFIAEGEKLFEVKIVQEKRPSLACKMDLWETPRAELPEDAFDDQIFESAEIVDVATGEHRAPIASEKFELETNDQGIAIDVASTNMTLVGSIGTKLSFVETGEQWPCGTMHVQEQTIHVYDASTGKPADTGTCSNAAKERAQASFEAEATEMRLTLNDTTCEGVTLQLDEQHRYVARQHFTNYASPEYGSNGWFLRSDQDVSMANDYDTDLPVVVGTYLDAHADARGYSTIDTASVRDLFTRDRDQRRN